MPTATHNAFDAQAWFIRSPVVSFTTTVNGLTVSVDCGASYGTTGMIVLSSWDFGDGATATGVTQSHTYASAGNYVITYYALQADGGTMNAQSVVTVAAVSGPAHVWDTSDARTGLPSSGFTYLNYTDYYQTGDLFQDTISRLPTVNTSNPTVLLVPSGFDVTIPDFSQIPSGNASGAGFYSSKLVGIGCIAGPTQARIKQAPNSLTSGQVTALNGQSSGTTQMVNGRIGYNATSYVFGITFEGSQQAVNKLQGMTTYSQGPGTIYQYCRFLGYGYADDSSPPGETFSWADNRSQNLIFRHCEIDGRLRTDTAPVGSSGFTNPTMGSRVSGMWGANGSTNITIDTCYLHDSARSGVTFSYAGASYDSVGQPLSPTTDVTTNNMHVSYNDFHSSSATFPGINHEGVMGTITHNNPIIEMDPAGFGTAWNNGHINWCGTSETNGNLTINEPTWTGSANNAPGYFAIRTYGWYTGSDTGYKDLNTPTVIKNGVSLQPWIRTSSTVAPNGYSPSTHYLWNKG